MPSGSTNRPNRSGRGLILGAAGVQHIMMALPRLDSSSDFDTVVAGIRAAAQQLAAEYPGRRATPGIRLLPGRGVLVTRFRAPELVQICDVPLQHDD